MRFVRGSSGYSRQRSRTRAAMVMLGRSLSLLPLSMLVLPHVSAAFTITVPEDYPTIQAALDATSAGDTVRVLPGTYTGPGNRDLSFGGKNLVLLGSGAEVTVLDCQGGPADPHRGINFLSGEDSTAVLQGLTIRNGYSSAWSGGINCRGASPRIRHCVVENCTAATFGGGIGIWGDASPIIEDCRVSANSAGTHGGGIGVSGADARILRCEIRDNEYGQWGGGIWVQQGVVVVSECEIKGNWGGSSGGGITAHSYRVEVYDSVISGNSSSSSGGGITAGYSQLVVLGTVVSGNVSGYGGGVTCSPNVQGHISSSTISGNIALSGGGGGISTDAESLVLDAVVLWGNCGSVGSDIYVGEDGSGPVDVPISCCIIDPTGIGGPGSIDYDADIRIEENPLFCQPTLCAEAPTTAGEFTVADDSPCLPQNNPCGVQIGALPADCTAASVPAVSSPAVRAWVFPSPVRASETLLLRLQEGDFRVELFDAGGRQVAVLQEGVTRTGPSTRKIDLRGAELAPGVYYLRVIGSETTRTSPVVVVR